MPELTQGPSPFRLWLEEALTGWILPVAAIAVVVAGGILYLTGMASETFTGALLAVAAPLVAAAVMVRPALDPGRDARSRALVWVTAALVLVGSVGPAVQAVVPGAPLFRGDVGAEGEAVPVPPGVSGKIRLLVNGKLRDTGEPTVLFTFSGTKEPIEGKLERTYGYARVGRGGRTRVQHDHTSDWFEGRLPPGTTALKLERMQGQPASRLDVAVYRDWLPGAVMWIFAVGALLLAAVADARLGTKGNVAVPAGMALVFGLLVAYNATPEAAVGPAVGGVVLGAMVGALAGAIAGWLARKFVPPARRRAGRPEKRPNGAAVA